MRKESPDQSEGGLFLFVTLPEDYDASSCSIAVQEDVAFVIGEAFHCDGSNNTLRINFSYGRIAQKASAVWAMPSK